MSDIRDAEHASSGVAEGISDASMRNLSGYRLFAKENRGAMQAKLEGSSARDILKEMGHAWSHLPEEEKKKWNDMAASIKGEHSNQI
ncbi:HMG (high mobility group) box domain-containing protein [Ditylenchus destructor]|uniref:HMG (High mobility group) box domain-containing protein n=1 Tax=Ditylenchus destructor TaxID=166010 RepID=A0AAD4NHB7_9BILA|nr:HMG (high mobility group) box domain-containing protein [Ditylenchus destructor]